MIQTLNPQKGQHLLINKNIVEKEIKEAELTKKDRVIEIGSGKGILTEELAKNSGKVLSFEIDEQFKQELDELKKKYDNLSIIYSDALKQDWKGYNKIVSNIPYFLAGDIILKAIKTEIEMLVLVVGEDFKEKLEKKQGKIGIIADLFYETIPIMRLQKEDFSPQPKVNSWMIKMMKKENEDNINNLLKQIIIKKGKIKNSIIHSLMETGKTKNQARDLIKEMKITEEVLNKPCEKITGEFILRLRKELENIILKLKEVC